MRGRLWDFCSTLAQKQTSLQEEESVALQQFSALVSGLVPHCIFFNFASIHAHESQRSWLPTLSLHYSITGREPLAWKAAAFWLNDSVCVCASFVQMAYECFSGTRKCGSGDMIPMDELGPGKVHVFSQRRAYSPLISLQGPVVFSLIRLLFFLFFTRCQDVIFNLKIQTTERSDLSELQTWRSLMLYARPLS